MLQTACGIRITPGHLKLLIFHVKVYQEVLLDYLQEASVGRNSSSEKVYDTFLFHALFSVGRSNPYRPQRQAAFISFQKFS